MKNLLKSLIIVLMVVACSPQGEKGVESLNIMIKNPKVIDLTQMVISSKDINLSTADGEGFLSLLSKVLEVGEYYYILDRKSNSVRRYNKEGKFINRYEKIGKARDEYQTLSDIATDGKNIYMLSYFKLFVLDLELNVKSVRFIKDMVNMKRVNSFDRIAVQEDKLYLYEFSKQSIYSGDKEGDSLKLVLTDPRAEHTRYRAFDPRVPVFYPLNKNITLINMNDCDNIYKLERGKISLWKTLDFDGKEAKYNANKSNHDMDYQVSIDNNVPYIKNIFYSGGRYFIEYNGMLVYNEKTGEQGDYSLTPIPLPYEYSVGNKLYNLREVEGQEEIKHILRVYTIDGTKFNKTVE